MMMRLCSLLLSLIALLSLIKAPAMAAAETDETVLIYSATDIPAISPVLDAFRAANPDLVLEYREFNTLELHERMQSPDDGDSPDLVISSAMDLQIRLVNDGFAQPFVDPVLEELPTWANWRNEAFGFTYEPVVFVYNKAAFAGRSLPATHEALATALRSDGEFFRHRVGSYDVRTSGVGYLVATQDEVTSSLSGRLKESLGRAFTQVYCCTSQLLDAIAEGDLVLGYNLLGSYALAHARRDPRIGVIVPEDYALVVSRVALITKNAPNPAGAERFLRFLLSYQGQQVIAQNGELVALHPRASGPFSIAALGTEQPLNFHPITLGPALMVYLDQSKRRRFIIEWQNALLYDPVAP